MTAIWRQGRLRPRWPGASAGSRVSHKAACSRSTALARWPRHPRRLRPGLGCRGRRPIAARVTGTPRTPSRPALRGRSPLA
eukprot:10248773-Alexandrium_andersonii.AAC.1